MFIAALCTIAKTWKQPKHPLTVEWIKKMYTSIMEYYSAIKTNEVMPLPVTWIDLDRGYHTKRSQTKTNII